MCDFIITNSLLPHIMNIITAIIALIAVVIAQLFFSNRSKKEIDAKFQLSKQEICNASDRERRLETLMKIEEIFSIIQKSRLSLEEVMKNFENIFKTGQQTPKDLKFHLELNETMLKDNSPRRLQVQLIANIYVSNLKDFFSRWTILEQQLYSCQSFVNGSINVLTEIESVETGCLHEMYIEMLQYFDRSIVELSDYSTKSKF